jgi:hypothetical protein
MRYLLKATGIAAAVAFAACAPNAVAQEITVTLACQDIGASAPEPLGDREGHSITVHQYSCRVESGPMSGGVATGTDVWEWDGPKAVQLSNVGVIRKPGATEVFVGDGGNLALTMTDGKVTGFTASGKNHAVIATGSAASMMGKTDNWTSKPAGPGQFAVEAKIQ